MKKSKKILSVILALVMVFSSLSAAVVAFAAEDDLYTDVMTEERVNTLIDYADGLLRDKVLTGDTLESIYKYLPSLSAVAMVGGDKSKASDKVVYYQILYPDRFADLTSEDGSIKPDVLDEEGNIVEKGTFTLFFEKNPIVVDSDEAFIKEVEKIVDVALCDNVAGLLAMLLVVDQEAATKAFSGLDKICEAAGIKQDMTFMEAATASNEDTSDPNNQKVAVRDYLKNVIRAILPDTANGVVSILRNVADKEDFALLYDGVSNLLSGLSAIAQNPMLAFFVPEDVAAVLAKLVEIADGFNALPTLDNPKRLDLEKVAVMAFDAYAKVDFDLVFVDDITKATDGKNFYLGRLEPVLTDLGNAKTNAEAVVILYNYIYDNVLQVPGNVAIILDLVNVDLPIDPSVLTSMTKDQAFALVYGFATGEDIMPEEPTEPTDPADPSEPVTDDPANPVTPPANGDSAVIGIFAAMAVLSGAALVITKKRS